MLGLGLGIPEIATRARFSIAASVLGPFGPFPYAGASLDFDFVNDQYQVGGVNRTFAEAITFSRTSTGYWKNAAGVWQSYAAGVARRSDAGLVSEGTRTNIVRYNRDLTNAVWSAIGITVAKDQTGIDGSANSASSITASTANGTVLNASTATSTNRWTTAFVKRLVGSGPLMMTMDGGATWTEVPVTTGWSRVRIPVQNQLNPTVGFRAVVQGDGFGIDFVGCENSSTSESTPIATAGASGVRAAETINLASEGVALVSLSQGTWLAEVGDLMGLGGTFYELVNARVDAANKVGMEVADLGVIQGFSYVGNVFQAKPYSARTVARDTIYRAGLSYDAPAGSFFGRFSENLGYGGRTDATTTNLSGNPAAVGIASNNGGQNLYGAIRRLIYLPTASWSTP